MEQGEHHGGWRSAPVLWTTIFVVVCGAVILPFIIGGEALETYTNQALRESAERPLATGGLLFLLLALDVVLPTPSSIVSTALGARFGLLGGSALGFLAMTISCILGYCLGRFAGGKMRGGLVSPEQLDRLNDLFARHGTWTLAITRPVPVLAEAATIFAGLAAMSFPRFVLVTGAANLGISIGYAAIGAYAADVNSFAIAFAGAMVLPGVLMLVARRRHHPTATGDGGAGS